MKLTLTIAEERIYQDALKKMGKESPQEIISSVNCQLLMLELPIGNK